MPGFTVPVSLETYGTSRENAWPGGAAGGRGRGGRACSCSVTTGAAAVSVAGRTGGGGGVWVVERPRNLSHASFSLAFAVSTWSHPEVATINSAHIASVLRRIASLQRKEDAGTVLTAQQLRVAALRMRHDPHHIAAGVAYAGDLVHRPVRVVSDVAQHNQAVGLELGRGLRISDVAAIAVRDRQRQLLATLVTPCERRVCRLDTDLYRPRQKLEPGIAHQRAGQEARLAQNLEPIADAEDGTARARVRGDRAQHRRKPGDGPGAKIITIAEAARQDDRIGLFQVGVAMPDVIGVRPRRAGRVERVRVAIRPGKDDYCDTLHS